MKILHILEPSSIGGVERIVSDLYKNNSSNFEVFVAIPKKFKKSFMESFFLQDSVNLIELDYDNQRKFSFKRILFYRKVVREIKPDIIHTHSRKACINVALFLRNSIHFRTQHMQDRDSIGLFDKLILAKNVDHWISTSKILKEYIQAQYGYVSINHIYNGVEIPNVKKTDVKIEGVTKIGFVGRLNKQKGLDLLIPILKSIEPLLINKYKFTVIGEGEEKIHLLELVNKLKLNDCVEFIGPKSDINSELIKFDFLLLPSRKEGLPLVMLEAMACGLPVVANNVGAIYEVIQNKVNGFIINSESDWLDLLPKLINGNIDLNKISVKATNLISSEFSVKRMCDEYCNSYQRHKATNSK
ncbi:glycosyltransferase [Paenibacillus riograndensis]|nr:glycosyltransferase [Paenibacillus riograndensis]